jgi:dGTPase
MQKYAVNNSDSRGRRHEEPLSKTRDCFQKDRDRIIHCKAFRRLKDKTQVFVPHHDDHARNRLSHTIEVAQIARDLARMLGLNEDLAEAIALAHDLGHTPFGHAGEEALNECLAEHGMSFEHNEQSRRIVEEIEHVYPDFKGLNLSIEVLEGLMKHQTSWDTPSGSEASNVKPSLEAQVVNLADEIAYQNHDVDDGLRNGFFTEEDLQELELWQLASEEVRARYGRITNDHVRRARTVSKMIGLMIGDVYEETLKQLERHSVQTLNDVYKCEEQLVRFSEKMGMSNRELKKFLSNNLYFSDRVQAHAKRGQEIIKKLFAHYIKEMSAPEARDFIAGMTDRFAAEKAEWLAQAKNRA